MIRTNKNPFKAALREGRVQLGIWSSLCSPVVAEILAQSQFDWVMFDAEHSPIEISGLLPLLQASGTGNASAVVRPPWNDPVLIKRILDLGAQTVLLPFVQNAEEAKQAVSSVLYPPDGQRGFAGVTRANGYGRNATYASQAAEEICTLVQVETGDALGKLEEIADVDSVDGIFVGPSDLAASLGYLGQPSHPVVQAEIRRAAEVLRTRKKPAGILAATSADAKRYLEWGFIFVACGLDAKLLVQGVDALYRDIGPSAHIGQ